MNKTLYLSDLDGTLLGSNQRISRRSAKIINRLTAAGMVFSCATARSRFSSAKALEGLELRHPMIAYNGTFIQEIDTGRMLYGSFLPPGEAKSIIERYISHGVFPIVYSVIDDRERFSYVPEHSCRGLLEFAATRKGDPRLRTTDVNSLYEGDIFYITAMGEQSVLSESNKFFSLDPNLNCIYYREIYSGDYWLEIMPREADKAKAALRLRELLGCERMVCFGDGINDLPMFLAADECYATANADPKLKTAATGIIGSNDEDAVALWLEQYAKF